MPGRTMGSTKQFNISSADTLALWGRAKLLYLTKSVLKLSPGLELRATVSKRQPPAFVCMGAAC